MKTLIINFLVSLLLFCLATIPAAVLTIVVLPFSLIYYIATFKWNSGIDKFSKHLHGIALSADQFANKSLAPLLNLIMVITKYDFHHFGDEDDTLSYVIAVNYSEGSLSMFGMFWAKLLLFVDYKAKRKGSNHLEQAIYNKKLRDIEAYERLERQGFLIALKKGDIVLK